MTTDDQPRRGRGQPRIGPEVMVRIHDHTLAQIDAGARARGITRAAYIRQLLELALAPPITRARR